VVDTPRCYLVPRTSGRLIVGATTERTGDRKAVTPWGLRRLIDGATEAAPALEHAAIAETWSGLRPGTPDGFPILGADPDLPNLVYATGHFRNGILLAPLTGERIGALLSRGEWCADVAPFGIARFDGKGGGPQGQADPPQRVARKRIRRRGLVETGRSR
jgi:glycine oxidase